MYFTVVGTVDHVESIAEGHGIRERKRLVKVYGEGSWRKCKGIAEVELDDGWRGRAELHWYEAHGIGKRELKLKRLLD